MVTQRPFNDHFLATFSEQDQLKDAAVVAEWLNAATGSESYVRVSTLLDEIRQVGAAMDRADKEGWYLPTRTSPLSKVVCDQLNDLRRRHVVIHQSLARYSYWPTLSRVVGEKRWLLSLSSAPELDEFTLKRVASKEKSWLHKGQNHPYFYTEQTVGEADVVLRILNLAAASELERVKQCIRCSKWFYAERSHQKFCPGGECRIAEYSKSPKFKTYRKLYMRRQRARLAAAQSPKSRRGKGR